MSCSCNDCDDITLFSGNPGTNGIFGGFSASWKFNTDTNIATTPTQGYLKVNNLSLLGVTKILINNVDINVKDLKNFLDSFNVDGNFGLIRVFKETDSSTFFMGKITGLTENVLPGTNATYHTLDVTWIQAYGSFSSDDSLVVSYTPIGHGVEGGSIATSTQVVSSTSYAVPAGYTGLALLNNTGVSKNYKVDVSFVCGDETGLTPYAVTGGCNLACGVFVNGVQAYETVSRLESNVAAPTWDVGVAYRKNDIVLLSGVYYKALQTNTGAAPSGGAPNWVVQVGFKGRSGGAFSVPSLTLPNNQSITVRFKALTGSPENGKLLSATFCYKEL
jgi:hypothetical protein